MKESYEELVSNRKAFYNYEILETFEAGIALLGSEVKSLKNHSGSLQEAYIIVSEGEAFLKNASISPYAYAHHFPHEERRNRKLLLHKRELLKLKKFSDEKGFAIIPLSIFLKKGFIKLKIAVGKGKKEYDKRQAIKERETNKNIQRMLRQG